jgi:hypothetical protein
MDPGNHYDIGFKSSLAASQGNGDFLLCDCRKLLVLVLKFIANISLLRFLAEDSFVQLIS